MANRTSCHRHIAAIVLEFGRGDGVPDEGGFGFVDLIYPAQDWNEWRAGGNKKMYIHVPEKR